MVCVYSAKLYILNTALLGTHILFGALKNIFNSKYLFEKLKGEVYKALVLPTLLYGCEAWSLPKDLF